MNEDLKEIKEKLEKLEMRLNKIEQLLLPFAFKNKNGFYKFFITLILSNSLMLYGLIKFIEQIVKLFR